METEASLTTEQLAHRWGLSPLTIKHQRSRGVGPPYITLPRLGTPFGVPRVRYPLHQLLAFEEANHITPINP